ncbi:serine--tRNA ligase [Candidatus Pacearchaeota archaeon RBG_13_36_9]|nr:MAG: serine--tRNA ligase [Candidatus Pacearchaeota archaeon RBG_13_36_9]
MIDIKLIRENPELVKESMRNRGMDEKQVDALLKLDKDWRELKQENDNLRSERNKISEKINEAKKQKNNKLADELIKKAKDIPKKIEENEKKLVELREKRDSALAGLPNLVDKSVPIGDASQSKVIKTHGKPTKFKFKQKDHADLLEALNLLDTKKASEVAGARFYYLKGDLVKLNYAIMNFALDYLRKKSFQLMQPPYMLRRDVLGGAIPLEAFEEMIYKIEGEDLYLIGTAEHALNAYHRNEVINVDAPKRYAGISPCFRKEAGSHGKDTKGIFRIHQFDKVEQFVFCKPEDSWKEFDLILKNSEELLTALEIPFRFVVLSSQDMGRVPTKTIDFEGWFPSGNCYRELGSCSNCLDYQARRSNIKYQDKDEMKFVHTLNNTAIATERMIACIVENNQQPDGSIKIPKALWKYAGFKEIKAKK